MKIWIVEGSRWDACWVAGVFSTEELAEARIEELKSKNELYTDYGYDEYIVDDKEI